MTEKYQIGKMLPSNEDFGNSRSDVLNINKGKNPSHLLAKMLFLLRNRFLF